MTERAAAYGDALYGLSGDEGISDGVLRDLEGVTALFLREPGYVRLLSDPAIPKKERTEMLDQAFRGRIEPCLLNCLKILTEQGLIRETEGVLARFRALYDRDHCITAVRALSPVPLTDAQTEALKKKLEDLTGQTVRLETAVDKSLLGGVRLFMNGREFDGTLRGRLDDIKKSLSGLTL